MDKNIEFNLKGKSKAPQEPGPEVPEFSVLPTPDLKRKNKKKKPAQKPKNIFSDETARRLLRRLRGTDDLPETLNLPCKRGENVFSSDTGDMNPEGLKGDVHRQNLPVADRPDPGPRRSSEAPRDPQEELAEAIRLRLRPWLWSLLLHGCLLILLAMIFLPHRRNDVLEIISGIGDEEAVFLRDFLGHDTANDMTLVTPIEQPVIEIAMGDLPEFDLAEIGRASASATSTSRQVGLKMGRDPESRGNLLGGGGGNGPADQAVLAGLRWLAKVQFSDGCWRLGGPYRDGAHRDRENRNAATAMALLAFQGYGVTPRSQHPQLVEFAKTVREGWDWLLRQQQADGCFFRDGIAHPDHRFYTHGLCTIALCELLAMTDDESYREPAEKAVGYCLKYQNVLGGWRYRADRWTPDSDVSVTGWIVMALKSGQMAGIEVPSETFDKISAFLDSVSRDGDSQYLYREEPGATVTRSMTAEALLCRELLGWKRNDPRLERGVEILVQPENLPTFDDYTRRDAYYWYYATQTLHHYGGEPWRVWNEHTRDLLLRHQEPNGQEAGSWSPVRPAPDLWGNHYGRLYTTCLSIYVLEVYYRHLRIY